MRARGAKVRESYRANIVTQSRFATLTRTASGILTGNRHELESSIEGTCNGTPQDYQPSGDPLKQGSQLGYSRPPGVMVHVRKQYARGNGRTRLETAS